MAAVALLMVQPRKDPELNKDSKQVVLSMGRKTKKERMQRELSAALALSVVLLRKDAKHKEQGRDTFYGKTKSSWKVYRNL